MVEDTFRDVNYFQSSKKHEAGVAVFQLGVGKSSHPCLAIPQAHLRGRRCPSIEAEPAHAPSWRVPGALGETG